MSEEEIKTDHFKTMGELLKHLKMWEIDDDYDAYYRFFCPRCAYEMAHKIEKLQKENDTLKTTINKQSKDISEQLQELNKLKQILKE